MKSVIVLGGACLGAMLEWASFVLRNVFVYLLLKYVQAGPVLWVLFWVGLLLYIIIAFVKVVLMTASKE